MSAILTDTVTTSEVAAMLGVTDRAVRHWRRANRLPRPLVATPYYVWRRQDIVKWLPTGRQLVASGATKTPYRDGKGAGRGVK